MDDPAKKAKHLHQRLSVRGLPVPAHWRDCAVLVCALRPGWRAVVCRPASTSATGGEGCARRPVAVPRLRGEGVPARVGPWHTAGWPWRSLSASACPSGRGRVPCREAGVIGERVCDVGVARAVFRPSGAPFRGRNLMRVRKVGSRGDAPCGGRGGKAPCPPDGRSERGRYSARVRPLPGSACVLRSERSAAGPRRGKRRQRTRRRSRSGRRRREDTARAGSAEIGNG